MKRWFFAVAIAAVASIMVAATATAGVSRNQAQTGTITVALEPGNVHLFNVTVNPDGTFTGTGGADQTAVGGVVVHEDISGTVSGGHPTFTAKYLGDPYGPPYAWSYDGPATTTAGQISDSWDRTFAVTVATNLTDTYKNHGDYVSSQGGGADAAHSPIAMPINSNK